MKKILLVLLLTGLFNLNDAIDNPFDRKTISVHFNVIPHQWRNLYSDDLFITEDPIYAWISSFDPQFLFNRIRSLENESSACEKDLDMILEAALQQKLWSLKILDSWGKPLPSGLLNGNIFWLGNYDECINLLYQERNRSFVHQPINTQYCAFQSVVSEPVEVRRGLTLGLCLPASCNRESIIYLLQDVSELQNLTTDHLHCSNDRNNERDSHRSGTIAFIIVLSLLLTLVFIGTMIDLFLLYFSKTKSIGSLGQSEYYDLSENALNRPLSVESFHPSKQALFEKLSGVNFFVQFSALRTLQRTFKIHKVKNENIFHFLDGLRVLSLFWVIFGHSISSGIYYTSNMNDMQRARRNIFIHLLTSGGFAVDTFFILSGFLTTVLFLRQVHKEKLSVKFMLLYYIHRYLRLTPAFILTMFVSVYLTPYFGQGPLYPIIQGLEPRQCRDGNWWTAFLYIGNFLKSDDLCLGITWYLYNDMQFYWIAPLALIPFAKDKRFIGYAMACIFIFISIGSVLGLLLYYPSLVDDALGIPTNATGPIFFDKIYMAPWCRIAPYGTGILIGFLVISTGRHYRLNRTFKIIGHILATMIALVCIFSVYIDFIFPSNISHTFMIIYQTFSRPFWALSIAWIIFVCSLGQGGIIDYILSFSLWTPLARLNYAAYLIHMTVILITVFNQSNPLYYQFMSALNSYVSQLVFAYLAATIIVILFEAPFFVFEKIIFKR